MNTSLKEFFQWLNQARISYTLYNDPWFVTFRIKLGGQTVHYGIKQNDTTANFSVYEIRDTEQFEFDCDTQFLFDCDLNNKHGYWVIVDYIATKIQADVDALNQKGSFMLVQESKISTKSGFVKVVYVNHLLSLLHASSHIEVFDREFVDGYLFGKKVNVYVKPTEGNKPC